MKKVLALVVTSSIAVTMFAGCAKNTKETESKKENTSILNETGLPIVKEKITLKMMGSKAPIQGAWDQLLVFQEMEKTTNIHFEFDTPSSETFSEKKNLAFASGQIPDVFFGASLSVSDEVIHGGQGTLIPLENLIEKYAPNLKSLMDKNASIKRTITTTDGHVYSLPSINNVPRDITLAKMWINKEWLNNLSMKLPANTEEFYQVLKAFKEKDPNKNGKADEIPLSFDKTTLSNFRSSLINAFGLLSTPVDVNNDKVVYSAIDPKFKEYLKFMNRLYLEGLLDNESYIQTSQQMTAKGNEGRVGAFSHSGPFLVVKMEDNAKYVAINPLTSPVNNKQMWPKGYGMSRGAFAITKNNKYPEASMRWVDYFYSFDGGNFMSQGPENVGWKWKDSSKSLWEKILPEGFKNTEEFRGGKITPNCGTVTPGLLSPDFILKLDAAHVLHLEKEIKEKYSPYLKEVFPMVYFKEDEQKRLAALETDLNKYLEQMEAKFITGTSPVDAGWDEYVNTIKKMGVDEVIKIYQTAYDRWKNVK